MIRRFYGFIDQMTQVCAKLSCLSVLHNYHMRGMYSYYTALNDNINNIYFYEQILKETN